MLNQVQTPSVEAEGDSQLARSRSTNTLSLVYKIPIVPKTNTPKGMLVVQVSADEIRGGLTSNNQLGTNYVLDQKGNAFLSKPEDQAAYQEINTIITDKISGATDKSGF